MAFGFGIEQAQQAAVFQSLDIQVECKFVLTVDVVTRSEEHTSERPSPQFIEDCVSLSH